MPYETVAGSHEIASRLGHSTAAVRAIADSRTFHVPAEVLRDADDLRTKVRPRTDYRLEAVRRGWGEDWQAIESHILADVLDNSVGRLGRPEEVADLVAFVASPLAGYINGANFRIDGGSTAVV